MLRSSMSVCLRSLLLGTAFATLLGCAGGQTLDAPPTRLAEINQVLEQVDATIVWVSGQKVENAEYVRVSADSVRYRLHTEPGGPDRWERPLLVRTGEKTQSRPIHEVERIVAHVGGGGGFTGLVAGAAPGLVLAGGSLLTGLRQDCGESSSSVCGLGPLLGMAYGALGALVGGFFGAVVGEIADEDRQVVYRRPIDRYLDNY